MPSGYRSNRRVTTVSPWVIGGDGELRDLVPLNPWLFMLFKLLFFLLKQWRLLILCGVWYLLGRTEAFTWFPALTCALFICALPYTAKYAIIWYRHPYLPIIARKPRI